MRIALYYYGLQVVVSQNYYGAAADIWSCGVILFELLAGFSPFEDSNLFDQYRKVYPIWLSKFMANPKNNFTILCGPIFYIQIS